MAMLLGAMSLALSSCTSFDRQWAESLRSGSSDSAAPTGCWTGRWKSESTGHTGQLRCIISADSRDTRACHCLYHATWGKLLSGSFRVDAKLDKRSAQEWKIRGQRDLGVLLGGTFTQEGIISQDQFRSHYNSKLDHGVLEMTRVTRTQP